MGQRMIKWQFKVAHSKMGKSLIFLTLTFSLYFLLRIPLNTLFSKVIVNPILQHVESIWYNDVLFFLGLAFTLFFYFTRFKDYVPSLILTRILIFISLILLFYRITDTVWNFTSTSFLEEIKYLDLFF